MTISIRLEDKINKDKTIMMDRLQMIFQSDGEYSKEEILMIFKRQEI